MQKSTSNIKQIVKFKKNFLGLSSKKIKEVYKVINKPRKDKPKINMIFKRLSKRQVLVPMSQADSTKLMVLSSKHVVNINKTLNDIKSNTMAGFIWANSRGLTIMTNKVTYISDLNTIEKYIKNIDIIDLEDILAFRLS